MNLFAGSLNRTSEKCRTIYTSQKTKIYLTLITIIKCRGKIEHFCAITNITNSV